MASNNVSTDSNNALGHEAEDEDRLTALTDDTLLSILERVDLATVAKTSVLSKRWRTLPSLLPELNFDVKDFLPTPCPNPVEPQHMRRAMASLTKAVRSLLGNRPSERSIIKLSLKLYMTSRTYSRDIGLLVSDAINNKIVKELDLAIIDDNESEHWEDKYMRQQARKVEGFFNTYPSVLRCLSTLRLHCVRFAKWDIHHFLFDCCRQLQHFSIHFCDAGNRSVWQINAPDSKLRVLEIYFNRLLRVEVLCLPKLEQLFWYGWHYDEAPLLLGSVPALEELFLIHAFAIDQHDFSLSEVFHGTSNLHTLTLNFQGEKIWIQPEGKQLCLRKLSINGIYVEFDLLWTINLLEAAPTVEIFDVEIFEHPCEEALEGASLYYAVPKVKPSWEIPRFKSSNKWQLKELQFVGFRPGLDHHFSFISAVMDRAPNLKTVLLIDDLLPCAECDAMAVLPPPIGGTFPRDKDEQQEVVKQLRDKVCSLAQIIFTRRFTMDIP